MRHSGFAAVFMGLLACEGHAAPVDSVEHRTDPETQLQTWHLRQGPLSVELIQRLPDQTRAFFIGRGFAADAADRIGTSCVFQAIIKNTAEKASAAKIDIALAQWRVTHGNATAPVKLSSDWDTQWQQQGVGEPARIAFKWSFFPPVQQFLGGDYNYGMISFGPAPGEDFSLDVRWQENGKPRQARIDGIQCAADR